MWLPWQQGKVCFCNFGFKDRRYIFKKSYKVSRKIFCLLGVASENSTQKSFSSSNRVNNRLSILVDCIELNRA